MVTGQLPFPSPALFWLLAKLAELCPTEACPPEGQGAEIFVRKSATKERRRRIPHRRPLEERQGLDGPERARTIRQDSSQKSVADKTGPGVRSPATAPPGPNSRPRQRTPIWCEPWRTHSPSHNQPDQARYLRHAAGGRHPAPVPCAMGGPPPATTSGSQPPRGGPPAVTGTGVPATGSSSRRAVR